MKNTLLVEQQKPTSEWTDKDWHKFRTWLIGMLKVGPVTVTFNKKDGSERIMLCTLEPDALPPMPIKESTETAKPKKENLEVISVYDLNAKGWRSFVLKNVTNIKIVIE
jgi:hypothetical protein